MHTDVMRDRRKWFEKPAELTTVLWWIPVGHFPTLDEAKEKLERLNRDGSGLEAFSIRDIWPMPENQLRIDKVAVNPC